MPDRWGNPQCRGSVWLKFALGPTQTRRRSLTTRGRAGSPRLMRSMTAAWAGSQALVGVHSDGVLKSAGRHKPGVALGFRDGLRGDRGGQVPAVATRTRAMKVAEVIRGA